MREHASARGAEVMVCRSGAILRALAAGSPRGCAQLRGSQPWAGRAPGHGLSRRPPPPPRCQVGALRGGGEGGGD